jgi:sugar phosphate permease
MKQISILIILALIATVISIVMGIGSMTRGAEYDDKHSGQFMNARIIFQGIAALLLLIALYAT